MSIKTDLEKALKEALRSGDTTRKNTVRMVLSAIKLAEINKGELLDETAVLGIVQKEIKTRREAIADAERAGRLDLVDANQAEITILQGYIPQEFSSAQLQALVKDVIHETGATSLREMGKVMAVLIPRLQGRATGEQASQLVRRLLQ
jgi:hypothetical protein